MTPTFSAFFARLVAHLGNDSHVFGVFRVARCPADASEFAALGIDKQLKVTSIMRTELDRIAENNYARKQGFAEGMEKASRDYAKKFKELGVDVQIIAQATGLSQEEVEAL